MIREYVYGRAAVSPQDSKFSALVLPWVDAEALSVFLAQTSADFRGEYCLMLLDGAGWHPAVALRVPPTLRLLPLPPYSLATTSSPRRGRGPPLPRLEPLGQPAGSR